MIHAPAGHFFTHSKQSEQMLAIQATAGLTLGLVLGQRKLDLQKVSFSVSSTGNSGTFALASGRPAGMGGYSGFSGTLKPRPVAMLFASEFREIDSNWLFLLANCRNYPSTVP